MRAALSVSILFLCLAPAAAQTPLFVETFDAAWSLIHRSHFDPDFNGVDWEGVRDELRPLAEEAESEAELRKLLAAAKLDTLVSELGLGTRADNALDRANVLTVEDFLKLPIQNISLVRGVGHKTRREITKALPG